MLKALFYACIYYSTILWQYTILMISAWLHELISDKLNQKFCMRIMSYGGWPALVVGGAAGGVRWTELSSSQV